MATRRTILTAAAAAALARIIPARAQAIPDWTDNFAIPAPLPRVRIINLPANGRVVLTDGRPDELGLIVFPDATWTGQARLIGFGAYLGIGGVIDTIGDGWMYAPNGTLHKGIGHTLFLQCSAQAQARPYIYLSRLRVLNRNKCIFGDFLGAGSLAPYGTWEMCPDVYRSWMIVDPRWGWDPAQTKQYGEPPAPAHHGDVSHSDFVKWDCGDPTQQQQLATCRHSFAGGMRVAWGFQAEFMPVSWVDGWKRYNGPDGRANHHLWSYVAIPASGAWLGRSKPPNAYWAVSSDAFASAGNYDPMFFHGAPGDGAGVWIQPQLGVPITQNVPPPQGAHFAPVLRADGSLFWPQTDWPEGVPAYSGSIFSSATPPVTVSEAQVGLDWRVTSVEQLTAYRAASAHRL